MPVEQETHGGGGTSGGGGGAGGAPPPGDINLGGGGDGSSTSGGTSGGTSSGGGTVPFDPDEALLGQFRNAYFQLWGLYPTDSYLKKYIHDMNLIEFMDYERHKPAWLKTEQAHKQADKWAALLHSLGVA